MSTFLYGLLIVLCLCNLAASDSSFGHGHRKSTGAVDKSLTSNHTQSDRLKRFSQPFYPEFTKSLPVISDSPKAKRSQIEARASGKLSDYLRKGHDLYKQVVSKLQDSQSQDSGPTSVSKDWMVTEIYPGNPALKDPSFPAEETTCDDSDDEDEDEDDSEDDDDSEDEIDIFATFALDHYKIKWDKSTFKDIIAYLKSNSQIRYRNFYGPDVGVLIAKSVYGQEGGQRAPDRWSDVVSPLWTKACQDQSIRPSEIRLIIQEAISNDDTRGLLNELTQGKSKTTGEQPVMFSWTPSEQGYYALLRSPNGIGAAYLSLGYPNALGRKYVSKITAYTDYDIWTMTLELTPIK